jgi:hypothetical protein
MRASSRWHAFRTATPKSKKIRGDSFGGSKNTGMPLLLELPFVGSCGFCLVFVEGRMTLSWLVQQLCCGSWGCWSARELVIMHEVPGVGVRFDCTHQHMLLTHPELCTDQNGERLMSCQDMFMSEQGTQYHFCTGSSSL